MNLKLYFGPDRIPFNLMNDGTIEPGSIVPFHGIISRGLLNKFVENNLSNQLWYSYAHLLHKDPSNTPDKNLQKVRKLAKECGVLSFEQSAQCTINYIKQRCAETERTIKACEIWNIKEGHTSSVWKVSMITAGQDGSEVFIVNIARDNEGGIELKESSEKLKKAGRCFPDLNIASVYEIRTVKIEHLPGEVTITRNKWIDNAFEIHSRKNSHLGHEELLMVERFLANENSPSKIKSVVGRVFSHIEARKIRKDLNNFLTRATTILTHPPVVNINDGDLVWNGKNAIVVAIS